MIERIVLYRERKEKENSWKSIGRIKSRVDKVQSDRKFFFYRFIQPTEALGF